MQINVIYDQSVSSLPAGFVSAVNYVVGYFDSLFTNPVTVNIDLGYGEIAGQAMSSGALGESETYISSAAYSTVVNALKANEPGGSQQAAYATLPGSSPLSGGTLWLPTAQEKALGLLSGSDTSINGYVGLSSSYPFSYSATATPAANQYYLIGVIEHEFSEVMGRTSFLGDGIGGTNSYAVMDLFRYAAAGTRQLGTGGPAYFSIDNGNTNLDSWNTNPNGDLGDWASSAGTDAFLAFSPSGQIDGFSSADLTLMNVLGWDSTSGPSVAARNQSVAYNQAVAVSSIFSVSGSGVTQYRLWFSDPAAGAPALGTLTLNGTPIALDQTVTVSTLNGAIYIGSAARGTDKIWLEAYNGTWSNWVEADITDLGFPAPTVTVANQAVAYNQSVALTGIFSVSGSAITQYQVFFGYPEGGSPALGTLTQNGAPVATDQAVTVTSLNGLVYTGAAAHGTDKIWIKVFNGSWTSWIEADITDLGIPAPGVTVTNQAVAYNQSVALTGIFSVSGSGITQYQVFFGYPQGGSPALGTLTQNGTPVATDQAVTVTSLNGLVYTGSAAHGTDKIWIKVFNGNWTGWIEADISDPGIAPPAITPVNQTVQYNQSVSLSSMFSVSGSGITQYQLWFGYPEGGAPALGTVTHNGVPIGLDQAVTLTSLSGLSYTGSAAQGTDKIWLKAFNGNWTGWVEADVTDPGVPPLSIRASDQAVAANQSVSLSNIFSASGSGATQYQLWFGYPEGGAPALGTLTQNGLPIALDQAVNLTSLNGLVYTGSDVQGTDKIWLKAFNGTWTQWTEADIIDTGSASQPADGVGSTGLLNQYLATSFVPPAPGDVTSGSSMGGSDPSNLSDPTPSIARSAGLGS